MVQVHTAGSLAEAELVRVTLEAAGHGVRLQGGSRPGLAGGIPIPDAVVGVWVSEADAPGASALLASLEGRAHLEWVCAACAERNPVSFETCWNCQLSAN